MMTLNKSKVLLIVGIILIAANLRPALTSVGPLIGQIRIELGLTNGQAGLITTLPLIGFAVLSIVAPELGRRFGNSLMLLLGLIALAIGILIRSIAAIPMLFLGTMLLGLAIALSNVLLPALIKHQFPDKVGLMTGIYTTSMGIFAAIASGISVPLTQIYEMSWQVALSIWSILALLAAILWLPQLRNANKKKNNNGKKDISRLMRSRLAWKVTAYMGLSSLAFYVTVAWLPEILIDQGIEVAIAGWMLSLVMIAGIPASFIISILADHRSDQRVYVLIIGCIYSIGFVGLLSGNTSWMLLWTICIGVGQGANFSLALTLLGLRAKTPEQVSALSGMAQCFGYILAAIGPVFFGYIRDFTHAWTLPLMLLIATVFLQILSGFGAGRNNYVLVEMEE